MRYLSLFSGIEAASVGWRELGWELAGVSEIDPYGCAALAHHHPNVPNLGDVTKITEADIAALGHLDLIVFGSPCQDLSIAGKRRGLDGERSGLFFTAMRIVGWARKHCGLRWALWENVPGAFSSNRGGDFAVVVEQMAGLAGIEVPPKGWGKEGAAVGSEGLVEWSTLDAQWFGVAQRRKRVFALADFGDWSSRPPILLEPQGLRGDHAPVRVERETTTPITSTSTGERSCWWDGGQVSQTLDAVLHKGQMMPEKNRFPVVLVKQTGVTIHGTHITCQKVATYDDVSQCLRARTPGNLDNSSTTIVLQTTSLCKCEFCGYEFEDSLGRYGCPNCLGEGSDCEPLSFSENQQADVALSETTTSLKGPGGKPGQGYQTIGIGHRVRRLTPTECERLQGFPDNHTLVPHRGKPAADSPRYKALGNSMCTNVMRWIGTSIDFAHHNF